MKNTISILFAVLSVLLIPTATTLMFSQTILGQINKTANVTGGAANVTGGAAANNNTLLMSSQNITGSIKLVPTIMNALESKLKISLGDASNLAEKFLGNSSNVVIAKLGKENGYLVYKIQLIDPDLKSTRIIVDPTNGKVLLSQKLPSQNETNALLFP
jgi:hypothetical protein